MSAVVTLAGRGPVAVPGVEVTAYLPAVGAEVVRGTPAALARLGRADGIAGLRYDAPVRPTGSGFDSADEGVFAWQGLGPRSGRPDAGRGVTVAVVDTGISDTPALNRASGRLVDGVDTSPLANDGDPRTEGDFTDGFGHGTFMATLLAGGHVAGSGRAVGVAPGARVVSVKVADDRGVTSLSAVLAGMDWVATHRPIDVVSLALAAERPSTAYGADPLTAAVEHLRDSGLTVVVAAGNDPGQLGDPGFDPRIVTVGAADMTGSRPAVAPFSGSGVVAGVQKPDIVASGVSLLGFVPADSEIARRYPQAQQPDGFWRGSGTSEATAVAAGVTAMYLSDHRDAGPSDVKTAMRAAAQPMSEWPAGAGLLAVPDGTETPDVGEPTLLRPTWWINAWDSPGWVDLLAKSWSTGVWNAKSWSANPWAGDGWSAKSWSAKSWSAKSWSVKSWSVKSWSYGSWSSHAWVTDSWDAKSWSSQGWGQR